MATLEVELWGEKIRLSSDQDQAFIMNVADYLNAKMDEVNHGKELTTKIVALRTAFVIAAEYVKMCKTLDKLDETVAKLEKNLEELNF